MSDSRTSEKRLLLYARLQRLFYTKTAVVVRVLLTGLRCLAWSSSCCPGLCRCRQTQLSVRHVHKFSALMIHACVCLVLTL